MLPATSSSHSRHRQDRRSRSGRMSRSSSVIGVLKTIVNPFTWWTAADERTGDKRRLRGPEPPAAGAGDDAHDDDAQQPARKKLRYDAPAPPAPAPPAAATQPAPQQDVGYNDAPPELLVRDPARPRHARRRGATRLRPTASPPPRAASYSRSSPASSVPPPSSAFNSRETIPDVPRDTRTSSIRDMTMSPTPTSFQLRARSTMTPVPSGLAFGPGQFSRLGREVSEPPQLSTLQSNPTFVKPPLHQARSMQRQSSVTLGSLAEAHRRTGSPLTRGDTLNLKGSSSMTEGTGSNLYFRSTNRAEKALQGLDIYKTPLLPTRLRGTTQVPEALKPKKVHTPLPMSPERDARGRLGTDKKEAPSVAPYAGQGGMRRMLARRRQEEEDERAREREEEIVSDQEEARAAQESQRRADEAAKEAAEVLPPIPPADFDSAMQEKEKSVDRKTSTLRVGRSAITRQHISRPASRPKSRFSAIYDDDEGDEAMGAEEGAKAEPPKPPAPLFKPPAGFSFGSPTAPVQTATSVSKDGPIAALPFSLTKFSAPTAASPAPHDAGKSSFGSAPLAPTTPLPTVTAESTPGRVAAAPATPGIPGIPSISLTPPTPGPAIPPSSSLPLEPSAPILAKHAASEKPSGAIPTFFSDAAVFSKPGAAVSPPVAAASTAPLGDTSAAAQRHEAAVFGEGTPKIVPVPKAPEAETKADKQTANPLFGGAVGSSAAPVSAFAPTSTGPTSSLFGGSPAPSSTPLSPFGAPPAKPAEEPAKTGSPFTFGAPATSNPAEEAPKPSSSPFTFGIPAKPTDEPPRASSPFTFGAPTKPTEESARASSPFTFGGPAPAAKAPEVTAPSPFKFGETKPAEKGSDTPGAAVAFGAVTSANSNTTHAAPFAFGGGAAKPDAKSESKGPFGGAPPTPSPFGGFGGGAASGTEAPKPFAFGAGSTTASSSALAGDSKPLFGATPPTGFSFGTPANGVAAATSASAPKPFTFGQPASGAPVSNGSDASKPFVFGSSAPPRSVTPPRNVDQEVSMDESPTRGGGMDLGANKPEEPKAAFSFGPSSGSSPFSFGGAPSSSPFSAKPTEAKPEVKPATSFGNFGSTGGAATGFPFGAKPAESTAPPLSPSPFGSAPTGGFVQPAAPSNNAPFAFGAQSSAPGFGPASNAGSAPASPSTFNAPAPASTFAFGATPTSATAPSNPFSFGSQPASPATGSSGLPQQQGGASNPFSFGQPSPVTGQPHPSPFGTAPAPTNGAPLFTIGSASAPNPGGAGRQIKKLPNRRGGKR